VGARGFRPLFAVGCQRLFHLPVQYPVFGLRKPGCVTAPIMLVQIVDTSPGSVTDPWLPEMGWFRCWWLDLCKDFLIERIRQ
jgi:hypothetical protein